MYGIFIFIIIESCRLCQFLIGKVQQDKNMKVTENYNAYVCQFLIGKVQLYKVNNNSFLLACCETVSIPYR